MKNEHPTFEDYLEHKMMLFDHSEQIILNADSDHFSELIEHAEMAVPRDGICLYGREDEDSPKADVYYETVEADLQGMLAVRCWSTSERLGIAGEYHSDGR